MNDLSSELDPTYSILIKDVSWLFIKAIFSTVLNLSKWDKTNSNCLLIESKWDKMNSNCLLIEMKYFIKIEKEMDFVVNMQIHFGWDE